MAPRARFDQDYYRTLGLGPEATAEEIRRAYRRLALEWHPDRNPGNPQAAERFVEISEAYAVLVDPAKRAAYDRARRLGAPAEFRHSREDLFRDLFADPGASAIFEELAREFERLGMRVDRRYFRQTLFGGRAVVTGGIFVVTPLTPVLGLFRLVRAAVRGAPPPPVGTREALPLPKPRGLLGRLVGTGLRALGLRGGAGATSEDVTFPLGLTRDEAEHGVRKRLTLGRSEGEDEVLVTIPAGTLAGTRLRLRGKGRPGPGGTRGDAYLVVEITDGGARRRSG